jgi:hypothetical protein
MDRCVRWICLGLLLAPLAAGVQAQVPVVVAPAPVVTCYSPPPVVVTPAPVVTTYHAPAVVQTPVTVTRYRYGVLGLRKLDVVNYGAPVVTPVRSYYYPPAVVVP